MRKKVAVLVQSQRGYGRGLLQGISSYVRANRAWSIYHDERVLSDSIPDWFRSWKGDGVIASFETQELADIVLRASIPAVDFHGGLPMERVPAIQPDEQRAVELAYAHLRKSGFRSLAYCGFRGVEYSDRREEIFQGLGKQDELKITVLDSPFPHAEQTSSFEADGFLHQSELSKWLVQLSKPVGILCCNDIRGAQVLNAARECNIRVPDDVAIVGMDNDRFVCGLCDPPLSSVDLDTSRIGLLAATVLEEMMQGKPPSEMLYRFEPAGVVVRESSDIFATSDPDVAEALRYIHQHAGEGLSVEDVVAVAAMSRSSLERRFARSAGRSIKSEINRVRLKRVKELLVNSEYSLSRIADMVGFSHAEYMSRFFRKFVGMAPGQYRKEHSKLAD